MNRFKRFILIGIILCALVAYAFRFKKLNDQFPDSTVQIISQGETVEADGLKYMSVSGEILHGKEYAVKYDDENDFDDDDEVFVSYLKVENMTDEDRKAGIPDMTLSRGFWANGVDYLSLWYINGEDFDDVVKAYQTKTFGLAVNINRDLKKMEDSDWRIRIHDWPNRIELIVNMNGERQ